MSRFAISNAWLRGHSGSWRTRRSGRRLEISWGPAQPVAKISCAAAIRLGLNIMTHTEIEVTAELVRDLLRDQHPDLADYPVCLVRGAGTTRSGGSATILRFGCHGRRNLPTHCCANPRARNRLLVPGAFHCRVLSPPVSRIADRQGSKANSTRIIVYRGRSSFWLASCEAEPRAPPHRELLAFALPQHRPSTTSPSGLAAAHRKLSAFITPR